MVYTVKRKPKPDWKYIKEPNHISRSKINRMAFLAHQKFPGVNILVKKPDKNGQRWIDIRAKAGKHSRAYIQLCVDNLWRSQFCMYSTKAGKTHPLPLSQSNLFQEAKNLHPGHKSPYVIPYRHAYNPEYQAIIHAFPREASAALHLIWEINPTLAAQWQEGYLKDYDPEGDLQRLAQEVDEAVPKKESNTAPWLPATDVPDGQEIQGWAYIGCPTRTYASGTIQKDADGNIAILRQRDRLEPLDAGKIDTLLVQIVPEVETKKPSGNDIPTWVPTESEEKTI